jgi:3-deoxy-D-manno-octulosonic-acid transferase
MRILYDTGIFLYHLMVSFLAPLNLKASQFRRGRKDWRRRLASSVQPGSRYIWFHCASLGEFEQGRPVMEALRREFPSFSIVLSFFSPSGYEIRKNYSGADVICYLPADTRRNASDFIEIIRPEKVFFVKYEFWFHFADQLGKRNIPLYLISGIFRKEQRFFSQSFWGKWFRKTLVNFTHFFLQDEESARLLAGIGFTNSTISGDTRFDRVATITNSSQLFPVVDKFKGESPLLIAGSIWEPDEKLLVPIINEAHGKKFILVPHEISAPHIDRLIRLLKKPAVLFSRIREEEIDRYEVIIVDAVGFLSSLYRYGTIAYIGGGFGAGIHNILEAATFGLPVIFGPRYGKFREACQLVEKGGAFPVTSAEELEKSLEWLWNHPAELEKASLTAAQYVKNNLGATTVILENTFEKS